MRKRSWLVRLVQFRFGLLVRRRRDAQCWNGQRPGTDQNQHHSKTIGRVQHMIRELYLAFARCDPRTWGRGVPTQAHGE